MKKQKVCIIGGGLTGLITAIALSKLNLKIDLITGNTNQNVESNRTTAISQNNYNFLKKLKVFNFPKKYFWPCLKIKLYTDAKKKEFTKLFELKGNQEKNKQILYMMENSKIAKKIIKNIRKEKLINFKTRKIVSGLGSSGLLKEVKFNDKSAYKYNLIIICTGSNSILIKKLFRDKFFGHSYNEECITTTLGHSSKNNNIARQIFLDNEILAFLPISNTKTSIVWSIKKNIINNYKNKSDKALKKIIKFYSKVFLQKVKFVTKLEHKDLNFSVREKYFQDRVLLFGDALHTVHPLAGQGFNMMLRDLAQLEKILESKISLGLDIGSSDILLEFSNQTKSRNFVYSLGTDFIKTFFSAKRKYIKDFRNKLIKELNKNNFAKNIIFNLADKGFKF